jgi:site-specific DNA-methyltransferase (adenine-specific)
MGPANQNNFVVLDPFCGIGSTAVACKRLGISFIGFDTEKTYLDEAVTRVMNDTLKNRVPIRHKQNRDISKTLDMFNRFHQNV